MELIVLLLLCVHRCSFELFLATRNEPFFSNQRAIISAVVQCELLATEN